LFFNLEKIMKRLTTKSVISPMLMGTLLFFMSSAEAGELIGKQVLRRNQDVGYTQKSTANAARMNPLPKGGKIKVTENQFTNKYLDYISQQDAYQLKLEKWEYKKDVIEAKAVAKQRAMKEKEHRKALAAYKKERKYQEKLAANQTPARSKWSFGSGKTAADPASKNENVNWAPGQDPNDPNAAAQRAQLGKASGKQGTQKPPSIWERLKVALFGKQG
jgi:hypothetical protein